MIETTPAPGAASPETTTTSVTPAETAPSAEQVSPLAETPAGLEQQQEAAKPEGDAEKKPTPAEEARKQRNRERWNNMRQERDNFQRRENFHLTEIERLQRQVADLSQITDPDEKLAEMTAQRLRSSQIEDHKSQGRAAQEERARATLEAWNSIADDMRQKFPDFDQAFTQNTPVHQRAVPFLVDSEKGGDIAYWLGKNPEAAADLYRKFESAPAQAFVELGRIEAKLSAPTPKHVSTAPKPAPVLNGGVSPLAFDINRASVEDVAAQLRKSGFIR